MTQKIMTAAKQ